MGLGLLAIAYAVWPAPGVARVGVPGLVAALGGGWALRLAWHLWTDRVRGRTAEDGRYAAMRAHWGDKAPARFFWFYQGQALVAVVFSLPMLAAMRGGRLDGWAVAGVIVWLVAVAGEAAADRQLARFRADPANRGRACRHGLWRWSRHPNYFFEWLHWWTYVLIGHGALLTWLGPALMLLFLFRLTGIPYTEAQALRSRGEDYRRYQRETSVFFPWPARRDA
jgi:steroid 5-alpha reductase family enzyme